MHSKPELREILYIFSPLLIYLLIYFAVSSLTEAVLWGIEQHSAAVTPDTGDPALYYAAGIFRKYICQILPTAAGCLGVRRTAIAEISAFPRKYPLVLRDSGWKTPVPENIYPVLLTSTAALAAALNVLFSILLPVPEMSAMESTFVPGLTGLILQAAFYGFFMPFSEELLFRGILFARLERAYGLYFAAAASSAVFGAWHGSLAQGFYAFFMGLVFALSYARTGRIIIPFALHSVCNLIIIVLEWTNAYPYICTLPWCAALFAVSAGGLWTIRISLKEEK